MAAALGVPNRFIALDDSPVDPQLVLDRFVRQSEGRVDHLAGYVDGMSLWRQLHEAGVRMIVRGDDGFGWVPAATERAVRYAVGLGVSSDYANLTTLLGRFGVAGNELPGAYQRESGESLPSWRDRLYHAYRIPVLLAALSDLKLGYLELINPLLSRRILQTVRGLPDGSRTDKKLFKEVVDSDGLAIPYATAAAISSQGSVIASGTYHRAITEVLLDTEGSGSPLPPGMLAAIASGMSASPAVRASTAPASRRRRLASLIPALLRNRLRDFKAKDIASSTLAFRAYLVCAMLKLVAEDRNHMRRHP